ncbi:MAG: hypothetical protein IPL23_21160 [Saprospiraceae bacterium]|nr:hypothetical protein [Saprospiraceae bacterium]
MKKNIIHHHIQLLFLLSFGQETILSALPQSEKIALVNGTIHVGNGSVIEKGSVVFEKENHCSRI